MAISTNLHLASSRKIKSILCFWKALWCSKRKTERKKERKRGDLKKLWCLWWNSASWAHFYSSTVPGFSGLFITHSLADVLHFQMCLLLCYSGREFETFKSGPRPKWDFFGHIPITGSKKISYPLNVVIKYLWQRHNGGRISNILNSIPNLIALKGNTLLFS